jgi:hypothetical protein
MSSKTLQEYQDQTCGDCGEPVTLRRKGNRQLIVACACEERSVKVAKATPLEWSA